MKLFPFDIMIYEALNHRTKEEEKKKSIKNLCVRRNLARETRREKSSVLPASSAIRALEKWLAIFGGCAASEPQDLSIAICLIREKKNPNKIVPERRDYGGLLHVKNCSIFIKVFKRNDFVDGSLFLNVVASVYPNSILSLCLLSQKVPQRYQKKKHKKKKRKIYKRNILP